MWRESHSKIHTEPVLSADKNRIVSEEDSMSRKSSLMIGLVLVFMFLLVSGWNAIIEPIVLYGVIGYYVIPSTQSFLKTIISFFINHVSPVFTIHKINLCVSHNICLTKLSMRQYQSIIPQCFSSISVILLKSFQVYFSIIFVFLSLLPQYLSGCL